MARPIVKYLDPVSGGYEFATVVDIGDLRNLNTTIKSDIVGAINSIISDGVHNPVNDERIENLETIIDSLKDGTFQIEDFGSIDEHLKQKFLEELDKINAQNREEMQSVLTKLDTSVDDAIRGYQEKVAAQNIILENAENTLVDARGTLEAKAAELETAKIGFSELKTEFDELDGYITTNIRTIDFDNFNAMVEDYETIVTQTSDEVGVDMSGSTLSYLTGRVTEAEANISAQADEITSKMSYDEFQYMPVPKYSYGENLLFDTFDFGDAWSGKNGAQVTPDTFLFGKVVAFNSPTGLYETRTDDLTIGESYVLSTYVNVQPSEKGPSQDKYEPISTSYDPTDFKVQIGGKSFNPGVYEDLSGVNGWVRINQEFVADAVNPIISITPVGVNSQNEVAYMAMPKVEKGLTVTPWQPHVEDNYATISSTQSMIKQQANSITAFVTEVSELDDSYKQATSTFQMLADGFKANTEAVKNYEDAVIRYGTEYSNINGKFEQKVWKDDFKTAIEDINIDNRNRVLNSDFIRSEISSSDRRLIVEDWSLNSDWEIKTIDNDKYLSRNRTGLTQNLITSASSDYFPVRNGERILFGFDLIHSGLDNDKVFAIELFDISDKRLLKQEFSLSSLAKVGNRYHGSFSISTPGVEKGSVVLQLPKNGSVSFTKILFQNADIGSVDWSPAPEDSWIIQSKLETYISQVEDEITIGGTGQKLDTLTGLLTEDKGTFTLNPDKIAMEVFSSQTYDDMGFVNKTNFEQTADGWIQEITSEGRLAGYINASPDTYRISFDKILLEGTTWADALGSSKIMVTENFALIGKNGTPVLDVKNDGSINMNITSLKIGEYNALTTNDKSDIESEVADKVINTTKPYIHIAYADTEDGQGLSFNPSGKQYIGFAKSHLPTPSGTASNYEWSKYVGDDGYEGADGVGIKSTTVRYASSTSGTSQPSTGWSSTIPTVEPGNYLWTEIVWTYTNSEKKKSYTVARIGADGANGKDGVAGKDGVGIKSTTITYGVSPNETTQPATYTSTVPTLVKGQYLWTKTVWVYTDSTTETGYTKTYIPKDGNDGTNGIAGKDGVGIKSTVINYATSSSGTTKPTSGWTTTIPSVAPGNYLWTRTVWTYTDNDVETGYSVSRVGKDGEKGDTGDKGATGTGIKSAEISYVIHTNGTTAPTLGWVSTVPSPKQGSYLWTRTITTYTDNTTSTTYSVAYQATNGQQGAAGNGVSSTTVTYAQTTSGTTTPTSWSSTRPAPIKGQYLWSRTIITYTNGSSSTAYNTSYSATDGQKGDKGDKGDTGPQGPRGPQGIQGPSGSNGQSQWVHIRYSANSNGASMTTNPSSTTKYVGIAVTNSSSAPSYTGFTWSKYVGEDGSRGPQGLPGQKGDDGTTTYTWIRYADTPTSGMSQYPDGKKYIGMAFNKTTQTESSNYSDYKWSLMPQNIEVGGRNYFSLTHLNTLSPSSWVVPAYVYNFTLEPNTKYILSSNVPTDGNPSETVLYFNGSGTSSNGAWLNNPRIMETDNEGKFYIAIPTGRAYTDAILSGDYWVQLEKGNTATDWTPAPEDLYQYVDNIEVGSTNLLKGSRTIFLSSNNNATYPASITAMEENGRSFSRVRRTSLNLSPSIFSIYSAMSIEDINKSIFDNESTVVSFKARASQNVTMRTMDSTFGGSPIVTGSLGDINVTTEWKTFYSIFPKIPKSASGFRVNPLNNITDVNMSTFYIDLCEWKIEKGNKPTDWSPAPEDVVVDINKRVYNPVRYIRDWSNGSTANSGNHWYELMAIDEHGNNRALNRTVTSNGTASNLPHLTNGVTAIGTYVSAGNSPDPVYVQVDLGEIYYNIAEIKVWKYYNDGRTYHESKTEVSSDGVTWHPIYDYTVEGEYASTSEGKSIPNTIAKTHSILTGRGTKNVIDLKAEVERIKAEAYADGKVSAEEKKRIADAEDKYRKALILSRASSGKLMNSDPNFSKNIEEFVAYNNASNGNVKILYEDASNSSGPSGVTRRLRITTTGTASPTWGGIIPTPAFNSRANAEYVIRFTALLPKGRSFYHANNAMGAGSTAEWLTSRVGTGTWEEYIYYYKCGSTGSFSNFGHLYVRDGSTPTASNPLVWYLDKYEGLDISNVTGNPSQEDVDEKASAEDLTDVSNDLNTSIGDLSNTVDGKVDKSIYEEFLEHNANIQEQLSTSTANAQEDITKALARTATVEQKLGEGAADWIFTHTQIRMSDEGITLGEQGSGSYLQITNDQISFYNGSEDPVAFINGGMLNINHAIFVESIQISEFMFSSEISGHLTLRYVGN